MQFDGKHRYLVFSVPSVNSVLLLLLTTEDIEK